jgi:hypothetical protein
MMNKILSFASLIVVSVIADAYNYWCYEIAFCVRYQDFQSAQLGRVVKYENYPNHTVFNFSGHQQYNVRADSIKNS